MLRLFYGSCAMLLMASFSFPASAKISHMDAYTAGEVLKAELAVAAGKHRQASRIAGAPMPRIVSFDGAVGSNAEAMDAPSVRVVRTGQPVAFSYCQPMSVSNNVRIIRGCTRTVRDTGELDGGPGREINFRQQSIGNPPVRKSGGMPRVYAGASRRN